MSAVNCTAAPRTSARRTSGASYPKLYSGDLWLGICRMAQALGGDWKMSGRAVSNERSSQSRRLASLEFRPQNLSLSSSNSSHSWDKPFHDPLILSTILSKISSKIQANRMLKLSQTHSLCANLIGSERNTYTNRC